MRVRRGAVVRRVGSAGRGRSEAGAPEGGEAQHRAQRHRPATPAFRASSTARAGGASRCAGPTATVLSARGAGSLGELGLTELFFETVEPENADVPIDDDAREAARGRLHDPGPGAENGEGLGPDRRARRCSRTTSRAGPRWSRPPRARPSPTGVVADWEPVTTTIDGDPVTIITYQLIVEQDVEPHRHMIGKLGPQHVPAARR